MLIYKSFQTREEYFEFLIRPTTPLYFEKNEQKEEIGNATKHALAQLNFEVSANTGI